MCARGRRGKRGNRERRGNELGFMYVPYAQVGFRLQYGWFSPYLHNVFQESNSGGLTTQQCFTS